MLCFIPIAGCGRINFDARRDASVDGATPRCDVAAPFTSVRPLADLNSTGADGGLRLSDDEREAFFHSERSGNIELWRATRTSRELPFDPPILMATGQQISYWPTLSADGLTLLFNAIPSEDLFVSTRMSTADPFPPGAPLTSLNTPAQELSPAFGRTGTTVYFSRRPPDSVFVAPWPSDGTAQPVTSLDSPQFEQGVTLSSDDRVMYFGQTDPTAGMNIMVAERPDAQAAFASPVPVTALNTMADESPTWLSPDLCRLYFESSRGGDFDLYIAERQL